MSRSRTNSAQRRSTKARLANGNSKKVSAISQVRIIGGRFKRQYVPFIDSEGLRPTPDRLREVLFNWLQFDLQDVRVLDLCAGSGVLGFETLSRGASYVTFIEQQAKQAQLIQQTASKLSLDHRYFDVMTGDALKLIPHLPQQSLNQGRYDLVFIDPPYQAQLWTPLLNQLRQYHLINHETLIYIEDRRQLSETLNDFEPPYSILKDKKVGQIFASLIQLDNPVDNPENTS